MNYKELLKHYQEYDRMEDEELLDEAIASLEQTFSYMDKDKLMHHSRTYAISYLALIYLKGEKYGKNTTHKSD